MHTRFMLTSVVALFILSAFVQQHQFFNHDTSWLLEASRRMFLGGDYENNFFENNPPWILYIYLIPSIISYYSHIHIIIAYQAFVFLLAGLSLVMCFSLLKDIITTDDTIVREVLFITLAFIFLLLPGYAFGQREHLLVILTMPYFLLIVARLQGSACSSIFSGAVGVFAGAAFLMKPYFLPTLVLAECCYLIHQKRLTACFRPETLMIGFTALIYAILIVLRHPDYIHHVMPLAIRWCAVGHYQPWAWVTASSILFLCVIASYFLIATLEYNRYGIFTLILFVVLVGFLFSYFIQHTNWYYHQYPAFSMAILLLMLMLCMRIYHRKIPSGYSISLMTIFFIGVVYYSHINVADYLKIITLYPKSYGILLIISFYIAANLLTANDRRTITWRTWLWMSLFLLIEYLVYYLANQVIFPSELSFVMISVALILCMGMSFPGPVNRKLACAFYTMVCAIFLTQPIIYPINSFYQASADKKQFMKIADFINVHAPKQNVYFFTTEIPHSFPTVTYSNATSASRFSYFWWLGGMVKQSYLPATLAQKEQMLQDKHDLIKLVTLDIKLHQPKLIFVDTNNHKSTLYVYGNVNASNPLGWHDLDFDYINYFKVDDAFNAEWKSYRYLTTISAEKPNFPNVFAYHVRLLAERAIDNITPLDNYIYIYQNAHGALTYALKDQNGVIRPVIINHKLKQSQLSAIRNALASKDTKLDSATKQALILMVAKNGIRVPLYRLDVYERI